MSTNTPRVKLRKPAGTDPFLRSDFLHNYDLLDTFPGPLLCTSTDRPGDWGVDQRGMLISETDTGALLRWTGSAFTSVATYAPAKHLLANLSVVIAAGATYNQSMGTLTVARPCGVILSGWLQQSGQIKVDLKIDGVSVNDFDPTANLSDYPLILSGSGNIDASGPHALSISVLNSMPFDSPITLTKIILNVLYVELGTT